ncbi:MAG: hypothetical protein RBR20_03395 [Desulfobacterales bacterium]|nr:hypothetical protein [Desulfobacteraceae bacterium]MDY0311147.1 hypothetical protein [Desulfobacterales bacterium]
MPTLPVLARAAGAGFITLAPVRMDEQPVGAWNLMTKRNLIDQRKDHEP